MTYKEALAILNGSEVMVLNRDPDEFQTALFHALYLLERAAKRETKKEAKT